MIAFEIPLISSPQILSITVSGVTYTLTVRWCEPGKAWILDIGDISNNPIIQGIPLVTGADLLGQFKYLLSIGQLIVQTDNNQAAVPTFTNLGSTGHLYLVQS